MATLSAASRRSPRQGRAIQWVNRFPKDNQHQFPVAGLQPAEARHEQKAVSTGTLSRALQDRFSTCPPRTLLQAKARFWQSEKTCQYPVFSTVLALCWSGQSRGDFTRTYRQKRRNSRSRVHSTAIASQIAIPTNKIPRTEARSHSIGPGCILGGAITTNVSNRIGNPTSTDTTFKTMS